MIRKDRQGIAITRGSKRHKITFRDEVEAEQNAPTKPFASRTNPTVAPKVIPQDSSNRSLRKELLALDTVSGNNPIELISQQ